RRKAVVVFGERVWFRAVGSMGMSSPLPFTEMPLVYDKAFGGTDDSRPNALEVERRNPCGTGLHVHRGPSQIDGAALPCIEDASSLITSPTSRPKPSGFGCIGRSWEPRLQLAGTYDARWMEHRAPFLPTDFDVRYHQSAPEEQQFPHFVGGERMRCVHMAESPEVLYTIPRLDVPVVGLFDDTQVQARTTLDTVTLYPDCRQATLIWRARIRLRKKPSSLREVWVGRPAPGDYVEMRDGKPVFTRLNDALRWIQRNAAEANVQAPE
ncbi:MAG TPA: DUF2169 domain-containing protein, partial [Polyangiaceae bacterium]|nr:DUF2169 domain-containing protein [Polyangiaceae bacterium]